MGRQYPGGTFPLLHCTKPSIEYVLTTCLLGRQDLQGIILKLLHDVAGNWQQGVGCCALYSAAHHPDSEIQLGPEDSREHQAVFLNHLQVRTTPSFVKRAANMQLYLYELPCMMNW